MTWFKVDDGFWRHAKVRRLGKDRVTVEARVACVGLWTLAGDWSADNEEDGFVPDEVVETWDPKHKLAAILVKVGLWHRTEDRGEKGYQFHQWDERQPTRADKEAEREEWRRKKAEQRAKKTGVPKMSPGDKPGDTKEDTPGDSPGESPKIPGSRPVPSRSSPTGEERDSLRSSRDARDRPTAAELDATARSQHAQQLIDGYAAACEHRPQAAIRRKLGPHVDELIRLGWPDDVIHGALLFWRDKGKDPAMFPSIANEYANRNPTAAATPDAKPSTTDQRVGAALALADAYRAAEANGHDQPLQITAGGAT